MVVLLAASKAASMVSLLAETKDEMKAAWTAVYLVDLTVHGSVETTVARSAAKRVEAMVGLTADSMDDPQAASKGDLMAAKTAAMTAAATAGC